MQIPPGAPILKKKRLVPEQHPCSLWDTLTPVQRRKRKPQVFDAKLFVAPYVVVKVQSSREIPNIWPERDEQKRLEEIALLARWNRKHQSTGGSRSAGRPGAACKRKSGKSRRASR